MYCNLSMKDDVAGLLISFITTLTLFKLATIFRAGDKRAQVEGDDAP